MSFKFKNFSISDEHSAMKVGVDAVVLGVSADLPHHTKVLDLGSGTGIVSLILAQRYSKINIDAIEIDKNAFIDLQENFNSSPWTNRLHGINADFVSFDFSKKYDLIISNPPFLESNKSAEIESERRRARHIDVLSPRAICAKAKYIMSDNASLIVIFPFELRLMFIKEALLQGLMLKSELLVSDTQNSVVKRSVLSFSNGKINSTIINSLYLKNSKGDYSDEFSMLTDEFYLS